MSMNVVCVCVMSCFTCVSHATGVSCSLSGACEMISKLNWREQMARMRPWKCKLLSILQKILEILDFLRESESISS